jgi:hypothetical protein
MLYETGEEHGISRRKPEKKSGSKGSSRRAACKKQTYKQGTAASRSEASHPD